LIVAQLQLSELRRLMAGPGLLLRTGPVVARIRCPLDAVVQGVSLHYAQHPVLSDEDFADFHVSVDRPPGLRRYLGRQVVFSLDGQRPFTPLPGDQGFPLLEWGLNWCMTALCNQFLAVHSAVLEKDGRALIMPAPSGSGKSTLCAALAYRGWRLLSDELALIDPDSGLLNPNPRPISLKNRSIELMRAHAPEAAFGAVVHDTLKGSVCHLQPPPASVAQLAVRAAPAWVIFPEYLAGSDTALTPVPRARAFMKVLGQTFNHAVHGREGFAALSAVIDRSACFDFRYGSLDEAVTLIEALAARAGPASSASRQSAP
jgi:HprK-related kinase A